MIDFSKSFYYKKIFLYYVDLQPHYGLNHNGLGYSDFARHY